MRVWTRIAMSLSAVRVRGRVLVRLQKVSIIVERQPGDAGGATPRMLFSLGSPTAALRCPTETLVVEAAQHVGEVRTEGTNLLDEGGAPDECAFARQSAGG